MRNLCVKEHDESECEMYGVRKKYQKDVVEGDDVITKRYDVRTDCFV